MSETLEITLTLNGARLRRRVPVRQHLVDFLRISEGLTGTHVGCEQGVCGACTVLLDGAIVRGCLVLAVQADGAGVETIEGVSDSGELARLQKEFLERNALQCGFCTPGMLLSAAALLAANPRPSREEIRAHLSGNYCRCTGYHAIVDAVEAASALEPSPHVGEGGEGGRPRSDLAPSGHLGPPSPTLPHEGGGRR